MLRLMRDHAGSWVIKIILGAIVIVFVFWGVGTFRENQGTVAAIVNGELISMDDYVNTYNRMLDQYKQQFGDRMNDDMLKTLKLNKQALDSLISQKLMIQEAKKFQFRVTDEELTDSINKIEAFQRNGSFDSKIYTAILNSNRLTPEIFEASQRESLLIEKVRSLIMNGVKISDAEALEWFNWDNTKVKIDYVILEPSAYKDIQPSDQDIQAYFDSHKSNYKNEPQRKAQYLHFEPAAYKDKVSVTDEEIQEYYDAHSSEFKAEKTVGARHILFKTEKDSTAELVEEKRKKALEVMELAKQGKDFAELAKTYSEGPTKDKGGDLGEFKYKDMVKPFSDKAFSMKPGEISEPVKTEFGWHIIKVEKVNEEKTLSLEESKPKIIDKLKTQKAETMASDEAERIYDRIYPGDNLKKIAETENLKIETTEFFTSRGPEKGIKNRYGFASTAFSLKVDDISDIQNFGDGYYILQVIETIEEKESSFDEAKDRVKADIIKEKQEEKAKKESDDLLAAVKAGASLEEEAKKIGKEMKTTDLFKRGGSIPGIGYEMEVSQASFLLSAEKRYPENVIETRRGYYVIAFRESAVPTAGDFDKEKKEVKSQLLQRKQFTLFSNWLSKLKEKSQIQMMVDVE